MTNDPKGAKLKDNELKEADHLVDANTELYDTDIEDCDDLIKLNEEVKLLSQDIQNNKKIIARYEEVNEHLTKVFNSKSEKLDDILYEIEQHNHIRRNEFIEMLREYKEKNNV